MCKECNNECEKCGGNKNLYSELVELLEELEKEEELEKANDTQDKVN